jgi:hypothetical protein
MKIIATIGLLSLCASAAYAQGTIFFNNDLSGSLVTHIYAPSTATPTVETTGNSANDTPSGTAVYTGVAIGGTAGTAGTAGPVNYALGADFTVQLYALGEDSPTGDGSLNPLYNGKNTLFSSLQPVSQYTTTMATSSAIPAGCFQSVSPNPDNGIPNAGWNAANGTIDNVAALAIVCWYNQDNTITSYAAATTAKTVPYGQSAVFNEVGLGEPSSVESQYYGSGTGATTARKLIGDTSFSLISPVPEPSTIVLGVMGACAFLARRRMK